MKARIEEHEAWLKARKKEARSRSFAGSRGTFGLMSFQKLWEVGMCEPHIGRFDERKPEHLAKKRDPLSEYEYSDSDDNKSNAGFDPDECDLTDFSRISPLILEYLRKRGWKPGLGLGKALQGRP